VDFVAEFIGEPSRLRFLDVGCGVGITDEFLVDRVGKVHGIDVAEGVLATARVAQPDVEYFSYDGRSMPFGAQYYVAARVPRDGE
jgi:ubiquinone/menaquinone biosynthesis C-methylase UbiE